MSDIHGEYEAFQHILNSCSGVVKEKLDELYSTNLSRHDRNELATLIYYPKQKLSLITEAITNTDDLEEWYRITLHRLIELCRWVASKYTRSRVRTFLPKGYDLIIDELIHIRYEEPDKKDYYEILINSIIDTGQAEGIICAVSEVIKRLAVDRLHIVGDIFDRGPRADIVMDALLDYHSVDIQWGKAYVIKFLLSCVLILFVFAPSTTTIISISSCLHADTKQRPALNVKPVFTPYIPFLII